MSNVPKLAPLPDYDRERDGNVFRFIVRTAPKVRAQRMEDMDRARRELRYAAQRYTPLKP